MKTNLFRKSAIFKKHSKPLAVCIVAIFAVSMLSVMLTSSAATGVVYGNLSGGAWIAQAHYNTGDMGTYEISHTLGTKSASGIPNIENNYLPAEIFRGYNRWDANGGYFNLQSTPILSFDIWVDKVMQIEVGLVDTTNGYAGGYSTLIADTYHNGQANTPPYTNLYGVSTTKSPDGAWIIMVGPSDGSTTHYTVDLSKLGVSLNHIGQIVFDVTCGHQSDIHWKIQNITVSNVAVTSTPGSGSTTTPTATPTPTVAPTATPKPTATATPTPKPTATATPTPAPTTTPTATPQPTATPTQQPTTTPTPTSEPTTAPTTTPAPTTTTTPTQPSTTHHHYWHWNNFNWRFFWFCRGF